MINAEPIIIELSYEEIEDLRTSLGKTAWLIAQKKAFEEFNRGKDEYDQAVAEVFGVIVKKESQ